MELSFKCLVFSLFTSDQRPKFVIAIVPLLKPLPVRLNFLIYPCQGPYQSKRLNMRVIPAALSAEFRRTSRAFKSRALHGTSHKETRHKISHSMGLMLVTTSCMKLSQILHLANPSLAYQTHLWPAKGKLKRSHAHPLTNRAYRAYQKGLARGRAPFLSLDLQNLSPIDHPNASLTPTGIAQPDIHPRVLQSYLSKVKIPRFFHTCCTIDLLPSLPRYFRVRAKL